MALLQNGAVESVRDWIYELCIHCCLVFSHPVVHQKATLCATSGSSYLRYEGKNTETRNLNI